MNTNDVLDVRGRLDTAGVEWWIDGGWGVDALVGEETRPHDDLDLLVPREDVGGLSALFPELTRAEAEWWPARFVHHARAPAPAPPLRQRQSGRHRLGRRPRAL